MFCHILAKQDERVAGTVVVGGGSGSVWGAEVMAWGGGAAVGPQGAMDMGVMGMEDMGFF